MNVRFSLHRPQLAELDATSERIRASKNAKKKNADSQPLQRAPADAFHYPSVRLLLDASHHGLRRARELQSSASGDGEHPGCDDGSLRDCALGLARAERAAPHSVENLVVAGLVARRHARRASWSAGLTTALTYPTHENRVKSITGPVLACHRTVRNLIVVRSCRNRHAFAAM